MVCWRFPCFPLKPWNASVFVGVEHEFVLVQKEGTFPGNWSTWGAGGVSEGVPGLLRTRRRVQSRPSKRPRCLWLNQGGFVPRISRSWRERSAEEAAAIVGSLFFLAGLGRNLGRLLVPGFSHDQIQSPSIGCVYLCTCEIRLPLRSVCVPIYTTV